MISFLQSKTNAAKIDGSFNANANRQPKHGLMLLPIFFAILAQAPFVDVWAQTPIVIESVTPDTICASNPYRMITLIIKCTVSGYNEGNSFSVRVDTAGSSTFPLLIGTRHGKQIQKGIIIKTSSGAPGDYVIRVQSTNPVAFSNVVPFHIANGLFPRLELSTRDVSGCANDGIIKGVATGNSPFTFSLINKNLTIRPLESDTASGLAPGVYGMLVTDVNGCSELKRDTLIKLPLPSIEVSTKGNVSSCGGGDGFFTLRVFPRTGIYATAIKPYSFQMVRQGTDTAGVAFAEKPVTVKFSNLKRGRYMVTMKDGAGCASNTLKNIKIRKDTALAVTVGSFQKPGCNLSNGQMVVFADNGSHSSYRYSYSTDGGAAYSTPQSGHRFTNLAAGDYVVRVTDSRGCEGILPFTLPEPAGCAIAATGSANDLNVTDKNSLRLQALPNPTTTSFTLNLQNGSRENVQIIVTDIFGKKLYQTTGSSNRQYTFGSEFKPGMYIVQVIQGKQVETLKLVKGN